MDPFALPCHPDRRLTAEDRDWRAIGVRNSDKVTRKQTRCPDCKTDWTAYLRTFGEVSTVEWVRPTPFLVVAAPLTEPDAPRWQDATEQPGAAAAVPVGQSRADALAALQQQTAGLGDVWARSVQLVTPVSALTSGGEVLAEPGELLLERREKWNAQDRRLALLWSPRTGRTLVAWHSFARLLQD